MGMVPRVETRVETLGFYEADFVKTRLRKLSSFYFCFILTGHLTTAHLFGFWCLIFAMRGPPSAAKIKRQKSVTASSAQRNWLKRATE